MRNFSLTSAKLRLVCFFHSKCIQWIAAQLNSKSNNIKNQYNNRPNQSVVHGKWEKPCYVSVPKSKEYKAVWIIENYENTHQTVLEGYAKTFRAHSVENIQCICLCCCCFCCCCWMCVRHWIVSFVRCLRIGFHKHAAARTMFVFVFVVGVVVVIDVDVAVVGPCVAFQCCWCWCSFTTQTSAPVWMREISQQHAHIYIPYIHMYAQ